MQAPEGQTVSLTYDADGTIVAIAVRSGWKDESMQGDLVADVVFVPESGRFRLGEDLAASPPLPDWVTPFLEDLGAPKQQNAVSGLIEGQLVS